MAVGAVVAATIRVPASPAVAGGEDESQRVKRDAADQPDDECAQLLVGAQESPVAVVQGAADAAWQGPLRQGVGRRSVDSRDATRQ